MSREWYVKLQGKEKGPYSISQLKDLPKFSPDTLVWKEGFPEWVKAGSVEELEEIFIDPEEEKAREKQKKEQEKLYASLRGTNDVLTLNPSFQQFPLWAILLIIALLLLFLLQ